LPVRGVGVDRAAIAPIRRDAVPPVRDQSRRSGATTAPDAGFAVERLAQRVLYQIVKGDFMSRSALLLVFAFAGCAEDPDLAQTQSDIAADPCPELRCGENSPIVRSHPFIDLKFANWGDNGLRIQSFTRMNGEPLTFEVVDGRMRGRRNTNPVTYLADNQLIGAKLRVNTPTGTVWIIVQDVDWVPMWATAPGMATGWAPIYHLQWENIGAVFPQWKNVCTDTPANGEDFMGMHTHWSVVFERDRINATDLYVYEDAAYFSIGCAGHTLAKLYLTGHTHSASSAFDISRTVDQRTAMLKVLTADYCGDGTVMTVAGVKLQWKDSAGTMDYPKDDSDPPVSTPGLLEAKWDDEGNIICLEDPRLALGPTALGTATFGDIEDFILEHCNRPMTCMDAVNNADPDLLDGAYLVTRWPEP
jgi:hypothetical protein